MECCGRVLGDQALAPIPRDGGHRMLLFVHDRPQARGLAAARALYEANTGMDSVQVSALLMLMFT